MVVWFAVMRNPSDDHLAFKVSEEVVGLFVLDHADLFGGGKDPAGETPNQEWLGGEEKERKKETSLDAVSAHLTRDVSGQKSGRAFVFLDGMPALPEINDLALFSACFGWSRGKKGERGGNQNRKQMRREEKKRAEPGSLTR